jgi:hypothetical protein
MPLRELNKPDLWFTNDGDFLIDGAGDLRDTRDSGDRYEGIRQTILHRVISEKGAFRFHPNVSAGLDMFIGKTVDKQLLEGIQFAIHRALVSDGNLTREDYEIRVFEINNGTVVIIIFVKLPGQEHPLITMTYSVQSGEVTRVL